MGDIVHEAGRPQKELGNKVEGIVPASNALVRERNKCIVDSLLQFVYNGFAPVFKKISRAGLGLPGRPGLKSGGEEGSPCGSIRPANGFTP